MAISITQIFPRRLKICCTVVYHILPGKFPFKLNTFIATGWGWRFSNHNKVASLGLVSTTSEIGFLRGLLWWKVFQFILFFLKPKSPSKLCCCTWWVTSLTMTALYLDFNYLGFQGVQKNIRHDLHTVYSNWVDQPISHCIVYVERLFAYGLKFE